MADVSVRPIQPFSGLRARVRSAGDYDTAFRGAVEEIRWDCGVVNISFAVQGHPSGRESWLALARRAEELGFEALSIADHPGTTASPFVALAAAAQVTERIQLAPSVVNAGAWEPLALASEIATLDLVSDGRAVLGIGAGHTPREWSQVGREYPAADERLDHLDAVVSCVRRLLAGERVTFAQGLVRLNAAALETRSFVKILFNRH